MENNDRIVVPEPAPELEDVTVEELSEAGGSNCFGTAGSIGCPVCFGTYGCAT